MFFLIISCFFLMIQQMAIWSLLPLPFLNPSWTFASSQITYCWRYSLKNFEHYFARVWVECNWAVVWTLQYLLEHTECGGRGMDNILNSSHRLHVHSCLLKAASEWHINVYYYRACSMMLMCPSLTFENHILRLLVHAHMY